MKSHSSKLSRPFCHIAAALLLLLYQSAAQAQLCTGSLGDPVVNITFGAGPNPGPKLQAATTNYTYTNDFCPNDGSYTITNSTSGCFASSWHTLTHDHTGDPNGYMMLINASEQPGVFYLDTVRALCGATTYEFSAWILNILKQSPSVCGGNGNMPNIVFSIESPTGNVLQKFSTGDIPAGSFPQWNHYGFFFTMPPGVSDLVLRMTNTAPGGCGNDLALDDITFRPCGPQLSAVFSNINNFSDSANYCMTDQKKLDFSSAISLGYNNPAFQWEESLDQGLTWKDIPNAQSNLYSQTFSQPGTYLLRMSASESGNISFPRCRVASNILTVLIDTIPVPSASNSSPVCAGQPVNLSAGGGGTYNWTGPQGFTSNLSQPVLPQPDINAGGKYYVRVTSTGGCSIRDSTVVVVHPNPVADAGADLTICEGKFAALNASGGQSYLWDPPAGLSATNISNPLASPATTTTYVVKVGNQFQCSSTDSVLVTVLVSPKADAGPDKHIMEGQSVQLEGRAGGDVGSSFWTPPQYINDPASLTPVVNPPSDSYYTLHVASTNGCGTATDTVFVRVFKKIHVPNAFSPNNDGINDTWQITALYTYPESETEVFNRYGQKVFQSHGYSRPWDGSFNGQPLPVGTYYYVIDLKNNLPRVSGWVLIVR